MLRKNQKIITGNQRVATSEKREILKKTTTVEIVMEE